MTNEWSRYYHDSRLHELDVLHARFVEHRFARHSHEYFVIGYVETGVQEYRYRGATHATPAGHVFLANPDEAHTGEAADAKGYTYRTLYPRTALMEQVSADATGRRRAPFFKEAVIRDQVLSHLLTRFHRAIADPMSRLAMESCLTAALARLIVHHGDGGVSYRRVGPERQAIRRGREYIDAHFDRNLSLADLGTVAGLSPFHFARAFEKEVGLPPHAYQESMRIRKARELLGRAVPIAEVALTVGYADQSHLTRRFKRVLGITPGQYVREGNVRRAPSKTKARKPLQVKPAPSPPAFSGA